MTDANEVLEALGPVDATFPLASVTKVLVAAASWVAVEEEALDLDDPAGPPGSTFRHLLSHASGLAFDDDVVVAPPGERRVYSNQGFEVAGAHLAERTGIEVGAYVEEAVIVPLGLGGTEVSGSPATGGVSTVADLLALGRALLRGGLLVAAETLALSTSVAYPGLDGVLPGFGRQAANDWGLGVEIRGTKSPHWTPAGSSPRTFGHFGRSGSFLWVDPDAGLACAFLGDRDFGPWAIEAWPALGQALLDRHSGGATHDGPG